MNVENNAESDSGAIVKPVQESRGLGTLNSESILHGLAEDIRKKTFLKANILLIAVVGALLSAIGLFVGLSGRESPFTAIADPPAMTKCRTDTLALLNLKEPTTIEMLDKMT